MPVFHCLHGESLLRAGRSEDAKKALRDARALELQTGEKRWHSRRLQLEAEIDLHSGNTALATRRLVEAIEVAKDQTARGWELKAATRIAELWGEQGEREKARQALEPVYDSFTEGSSMTDLRTAGSVLQQLS